MSKFKNVIILASIVIFAFTISMSVVFGANEKNQKLDSIGKREKQALSNLVSLKSGVDNLTTKISIVDEKIAHTQAKIDECSVKIKQTQNALKNKKIRLNVRVKSIYKNRNSVSVLSELLNAKNLYELITRYNFIKLISKNDVKLIKSIDKSKKDLDDYIINLKNKKASLQEYKKDIYISKRKINTKIKEQENVVDNIKKEKLNAEKINKQAETVAVKMQSYGYSPPPAGKTITVKATAYAAYSNSDNGGWAGQTSTGMPAGKGVVAVSANPSSRVLPLGAKIYVQGYGSAIVGDIGSGVGSGQIDLCFNTEQEVDNWGTRTVRVTVY